MTVCRLLNDVRIGTQSPNNAPPNSSPPNNGPWNMAVDETLLAKTASGEAGLVWRFYDWSPATLSLGYFQAYEDRNQHPASRDCPVVRRLSGGGAILHDRELTYSLIVPGDHPLARDAERLYRAVHEALVEALAVEGVAARVNERAVAADGNVVADGCNVARETEPFLCFQRRAVGDVLLGEHKICGSAQRRWRGAILQHGSLLVDASPAAPELPGIRQLGAPNFDQARFIDVWRTTLARRLEFSWQPAELSTSEREEATRLADEKFATSEWNHRR